VLTFSQGIQSRFQPGLQIPRRISDDKVQALDGLLHITAGYLACSGAGIGSKSRSTGGAWAWHTVIMASPDGYGSLSAWKRFLRSQVAGSSPGTTVVFFCEHLVAEVPGAPSKVRERRVGHAGLRHRPPKRAGM
jgi:hypothetical protein